MPKARLEPTMGPAVLRVRTNPSLLDSRTPPLLTLPWVEASWMTLAMVPDVEREGVHVGGAVVAGAVRPFYQFT